jgi:Na+-translocating ferredoxin:NAD+ oxidoreductase RNF subunit RnfB
VADERKLQPPQIYQLLPKTNCGQCGVSKCMAFAMMLIAGKKNIDDCPPIHEEQYAENYEKLSKAFGIGINVRKVAWFTVDLDKCDGCGTCVMACIYSGEDTEGLGVLEVVEGKLLPIEANLINCDMCLTCEKKCPKYALRVDRRAPRERVDRANRTLMRKDIKVDEHGRFTK